MAKLLTAHCSLLIVMADEHIKKAEILLEALPYLRRFQGQ
jgi:hypothetical protein